MKTVGLLCIAMLFLCGTAYALSGAEDELERRSIPNELQRSGQLYDITRAKLEHFPVRYDSAGLDSFIRARMAAYNVPGAATWCSKNGQVIWHQCYGYARLHDADSIPVADTTLFMLAGISTTFTATAVMQLWERGAFGLDDDINDYLPFAVRNPNHPDSIITFRMLMTHTSSINDNMPIYQSLYVFGGDSPIPLGSFLEDYLVPGGAYYDSAANFSSVAPGHQWNYCNVAVGLLGYLVEVIEDSFPIHCQDSIFNPLSMDETSWFLAGLDTNNIAVPYYWDGSNYIPYQHYGYPDYPDGQLRTSTLQLARHLVAFIQYGMIDTVRILDSTTVELMRTVQYQINPSWKMGLIWHYSLVHDRWLWWINGGDYGATTDAAFCPAENSAVIILINCYNNYFWHEIETQLFNYAEQYGIEEQQVTRPIIPRNDPIATIFRGPLLLPEGKQCRVFDITGRVVEPTSITRGIYFVEIEGKVIQKVIRVR